MALSHSPFFLVVLSFVFCFVVFRFLFRRLALLFCPFVHLRFVVLSNRHSAVLTS